MVAAERFMYKKAERAWSHQGVVTGPPIGFFISTPVSFFFPKFSPLMMTITNFLILFQSKKQSIVFCFLFPPVRKRFSLFKERGWLLVWCAVRFWGRGGGPG